jgi:uncharacterized protein YciI
MLFLILRKDRPGRLDVRLENYAKHLAYLGPHKSKLVVGGPTLGAGTGTNDQDMTGSFLIVEAADWDEVKNFVANDPFEQAGLFATTIIERWKHGKHNDSH